MGPRLYRDRSDLTQIMEVLAVGRKSNSSSFYIHTGDLSWWLFYTLPEDELL